MTDRDMLAVPEVQRFRGAWDLSAGATRPLSTSAFLSALRAVVTASGVSSPHSRAKENPHTQGFFVPGPLPGLNEMLDWAKRQSHVHGPRGKRWSVYAENKQIWEGMIGVAIKQATLIPMARAVTIHYCWQERNKKRDLDNIAAARKLINDALVSTGILRNDGWKQIAGFTDSFIVEKKSPGVLVTLTET